MPVAGSEIARQYDSLYYFLVVISAIACVLVIGGMIYFAFKYRRKSANDKTAYITHNHVLEFVWSFIPFVIFMGVFAWGWKLYDEMRSFPEDAFEVHVVAKQWSWEFLYKSGRSSAELVVPVDKPVKLIMTSTDVLHSFFFPAMRTKQDVIPGRYTAVWFKPEVMGDFHIFCAEFCGTSHSGMITTARVVAQAEFEDWLANDPTKGLTMAQIGEQLLTTKGCVACHNTTAERKIGPGFAGIWGKMEEMTDGSKVLVDDNYVRESLLNPNAKIVKSFTPAMPTFQGQLKDKEIMAIIEYFKTLK